MEFAVFSPLSSSPSVFATVLTKVELQRDPLQTDYITESLLVPGTQSSTIQGVDQSSGMARTP